MSLPRFRTARPFDTLAIAIAVFGLVLLRGTACEAGAGSGAPSDPATTVVAEVGGAPIHLSQLEEELAVQLRKMDLDRQELLLSGLERLIETTLLEKEAQRRGITVQALVDAEVSAKAGKVTEEEIDAWYKDNRARIGRPLENVEGQIRTHLEGQRIQELHRNLVAELRSRGNVTVVLDPPRVDIDAAAADHGPAAKGPSGAPITLVEFSDFQCPWCSRIVPALDKVRAVYGDAVRIEFRHFPLDQIHPQARKASEAAYCAQEQGKFWQLHDDHFAHQKALGLEQVKERAQGLGLDVTALEACLDSGRGAEAVAADVAAGRKVGVSSTPSLFVNGRPVRLGGGTPPFDLLAALIDDELARQGSS